MKEFPRVNFPTAGTSATNSIYDMPNSFYEMQMQQQQAPPNHSHRNSNYEFPSTTQTDE